MLGENAMLVRAVLEGFGAAAVALGPDLAQPGTLLRLVLLPTLERIGRVWKSHAVNGVVDRMYQMADAISCAHPLHVRMMQNCSSVLRQQACYRIRIEIAAPGDGL